MKRRAILGRTAHIIAAATALLFVHLGSCVLHAGPGPAYRYGEAWWQEYEPDEGTSLLLHFGRPQESRWRAAVEQAKNARREKELAADPFKEPSGAAVNHTDADPFSATSLSAKRNAATLAEPPEGFILDAASATRIALPTGATISPEGMFGSSLALSGGAALTCTPNLKTSQGRSVEFWFRVAKLPDANACLLSVNNDDGRIILRKDGRVEVLRKRPHGTIDPKLPASQRDELQARDASLVSREPIQLGRWTHVCIVTDNVVVQGPAPTFVSLRIDGQEHASYVTEPGNGYNFIGRGPNAGAVRIGNNVAGNEPFVGQIDEVRVSHVSREFYTRPAMPWVESSATRAIAVGRPTLRRDGLVFHAPLDKDSSYAVKRDSDRCVTLPQGISADAIRVPGVRNTGWVIDPAGGMPRFDIRGMNARAGTLELWLRPVNWDDMTGYWNHSPPATPELSVVRFFGKDRRDGKVKMFVNATLPRANNLERKRQDIDPGHWSHLLIVWPGRDLLRAFVYRNGEWMSRIWRADAQTLENIEPLYAEIGASDEVTVARGERPVIEIDEVLGYDYDLLDDTERRQAYRRWLGPVEPLKPFDASIAYKASLGRFELRVTPMLPEDQVVGQITASLLEASDEKGAGSGGVVVGSATVKRTADALPMQLILRDRQALKPGGYRLQVRLEDPAGQILAQDSLDWRLESEPWRDNRIGILDTVPSPWTPIVTRGNEAVTRMTKYVISSDGLPEQIIADGQNILAGAMRVEEAGTALKGTQWKFEQTTATQASWSARLIGVSCDVVGTFTLEYDGMLRCQWGIEPKADVVRPITIKLPMQASYASRYFFNEAGKSGVVTRVTPGADGVVLSSAWPQMNETSAAPSAGAKATPAGTRPDRYGFFTQIDVNDTRRGLYWFADNAAGWQQSKKVDAQRLERHGDVVELLCNVVAEAGSAESIKTNIQRPIVFGLLPHPARPMSNKSRQIDRVAPEVDAAMSSVFDTFRTWPRDPRGDRGSMKLYPAPDPAKPNDWAASWAAAEACLPSMKLSKPTGLRTMYLSNYWFSCRAGAYDNWEWRNGPTKQVTHAKSFVDYSCWEIDQWIGRGIWDAIYLDECYEAPSLNVESGQAIVLLDGSVQAGATLFGFREMLKRWRNIFHAHGKEPMILAHHTGSFIYAGLVFTDAYLDGEGRPIISARSGDFLDQTPLHRIDLLQNCELWGLSSFYMPCVWEVGLENKGQNPHKRWSWRMARGVVAVLAHHEAGYAFYDQGGPVYRDYWRDLLRWGAGDSSVPFTPDLRRGDTIKLDAKPGDAMVSYYRKGGQLLVIASNLTKSPRDLRITIDREKLGIQGKLRAAVVDSSWPPAAGSDIDRRSPKQPDIDQKQPEGSVDPLDDLASDAGGVARPPDIVVDGDAFVVPLRARDFLLFSVTGDASKH